MSDKDVSKVIAADNSPWVEPWVNKSKAEFFRRIAHNGPAARTFLVLERSTVPMSIEEIAEATGVHPVTLKKRTVREMFNAQVVERSEGEHGWVYRLVERFEEFLEDTS